METRTSTLCRCCASEGPSKDLINKYIWMGEEEVYSDMLKECFDISLTMESQNEQGICELCITQLRNAFNFKKQVLFTDKEFRKNLSEEKPFQVEIKQEAPHSESGSEAGAGDVPFNDDDDDDGSGSDYEPLIKKEVEEKPKKRQAKVAAVGRPKRAKTEPATSKRSGEDIGVKPEPVDHVESIYLRALKMSKSKTRHKRDAHSTSSRRSKKSSASENLLNVDAEKDCVAGDSDFVKQKQLIATILQHSNATPIIRAITSTKYKCAYCSQNYDTAKLLKSHIDGTHRSVIAEQFLKRFTSLYNFHINLDITYLCCKDCGQSFKRINDLVTHYVQVHDINCDANLENRIFEYDFSTDGYVCVVCTSYLPGFKALNEHMNAHNRHYTCDQCGAGYITPQKLDNHKKIHEIGAFPCPECGEIFDTRNKRSNHRNSHLAPRKKFRCPCCKERFVRVSERNQHTLLVHSKDISLTVKCSACDRLFASASSLAKHKRKDHLLERNNACTECDMRFFSKTCLDHHMLKHTGAKTFQCEFCHKRYGRKNTLREHMRIHLNDRRFKCELCGLGFVQKCSLKGHMRSKHNELI